MRTLIAFAMLTLLSISCVTSNFHKGKLMAKFSSTTTSVEIYDNDNEVNVVFTDAKVINSRKIKQHLLRVEVNGNSYANYPQTVHVTAGWSPYEKMSFRKNDYITFPSNSYFYLTKEGAFREDNQLLHWKKHKHTLLKVLIEKTKVIYINDEEYRLSN